MRFNLEAKHKKEQDLVVRAIRTIRDLLFKALRALTPTFGATFKIEAICYTCFAGCFPAVTHPTIPDAISPGKILGTKFNRDRSPFLFRAATGAS